MADFETREQFVEHRINEAIRAEKSLRLVEFWDEEKYKTWESGWVYPVLGDISTTLEIGEGGEAHVSDPFFEVEIFAGARIKQDISKEGALRAALSEVVQLVETAIEKMNDLAPANSRAKLKLKGTIQGVRTITIRGIDPISVMMPVEDKARHATARIVYRLRFTQKTTYA